MTRIVALILLTLSLPVAAADLKPFKGDPVPPPLQLKNLQGKAQDLATLHGNVVLVNFWATWCPPCAREMPSMQRLAQRLNGKRFRIVAVDMGDSNETVQDFLTHTVKVDLPVWMDYDGAALKAWRVFVFPTSFLIDAEGKIRYGVNGALEWDDPQTVKLIEGLMASQQNER